MYVHTNRSSFSEYPSYVNETNDLVLLQIVIITIYYSYMQMFNCVHMEVVTNKICAANRGIIEGSQNIIVAIKRKANCCKGHSIG